MDEYTRENQFVHSFITNQVVHLFLTNQVDEKIKHSGQWLSNTDKVFFYYHWALYNQWKLKCVSIEQIIWLKTKWKIY